MTEIQKHMLKMLIALRWGVGFTGIFLPVILAGFGYLRYHIPLAGSMSSYYHATQECSGIKAQRITDLNRAARARWRKLHDAECFVRRIVHIEPEANLIDIEPQRPVDIAHRHRNHFD